METYCEKQHRSVLCRGVGEYRKKVKALFGQDPDTIVGKVNELTDGKTDYTFDSNYLK